MCVSNHVGIIQKIMEEETIEGIVITFTNRSKFSAKNSLFVFEHQTFVVEGYRCWMSTCFNCKITLRDKGPDPSTCVSVDQGILKAQCCMLVTTVWQAVRLLLWKSAHQIWLSDFVLCFFLQISWWYFFQSIVGAYMLLLFTSIVSLIFFSQ